MPYAIELYTIRCTRPKIDAGVLTKNLGYPPSPHCTCLNPPSKYYQPEVKPMPTMTYVGHATLSGGDSSERLAEEAVRLAGLPPDMAIDLYEQVTFD